MAYTIPHNIKPEHYAAWLKLDSTQRLLALEASWLKSWIKQLYGCHLAYVGVDPKPRFLNYSRTSHQYRLSLPWAYQVAEYEARMDGDAWPLDDESLDVVVLQHSLDVSSQPQRLIKEASRCLVPNGYLIVVGFNPYSFWGGWRWLRTFSSKLPWISRPVPVSRLKDWLILLDLKVEQVFNCAHLWPIKVGPEHLMQRVDRVLAGINWLPANAYLIVARKTVAGLTPIRMQQKPLIKNNFAMPVAAAEVLEPIKMGVRK